jgi:hypothetical protein
LSTAPLEHKDAEWRLLDMLDADHSWELLMRRLISSAFVVALAASACGCRKSDGLLQTPGRVVKGGESFVPDEGETISITFVPIPPDGKPPKQFYIAMVDQDAGTFTPFGTEGGGIPPGEYRLAVRLMKEKKDVFANRCNELNSPFVFEIDEDTNEIVIDLDEAPTSGGPAANDPQSPGVGPKRARK